MTPYQKLQAHLERHVYKRGAKKGDAPADPDRRGKDHFRVVAYGQDMAVRMWSTHLITVTPENRITINTNGWWTSTTKQNLNNALHRFLGWGRVGTASAFNLTQPCIGVNGKTYRYYDGMEFSASGELLSPVRCFQRKQTDRQATAEFRKDMEDSGFKAVWPVLFAAAEPDKRAPIPAKLKDVVTCEWHANNWAALAANLKCNYDTHKAAMAYIMRYCTADMTDIVDTYVTVI